MKFGICNEIFQGWTLDDTFRYARTAGYDAVEIAPFTIAKHVTDISAADRIRIKDSAAKAGVAISGLHWVLVQTEGLYLTHPDASVRTKTAKYFVELVNCCADLGGDRIIVGSPKQRNLMDGVTAAQATAWAAEVFRDAVKRAEDRGVVLCFEPLAPVETNFVNTAEDGRRFAAQFGSKAMSIILDVKAMCDESTPIPDIIRASAADTVHFHANDPNLRGPGQGAVLYEPIVAALRATNYDRWISVEVFDYSPDADTIADLSLSYLHEVFEQ